MRRLLLAIFLLAVAALPLVAQELPTADPRNYDFRARFMDIRRLNPSVADFNRMLPGEMYYTPEGADFLDNGDTYGIWGHEFQKTYGISYEESLAGTAPAPAKPSDISTDHTDKSTAKMRVITEASLWPSWLSIFAILAVIIAGLWGWAVTSGYSYPWNWRRERELSRDPVTSGTPYVAGGIAPNDPARLERFYDELAVTQYVNRNPGVSRNSVNPVRIGPIEAGTITGEGPVGYMGQGFVPRRITEPLPAYRARYRFPDHTEEELVTLQACMNPVLYRTGEVYRGFDFAPSVAEAVVPSPEPPTQAPEPEPAIPMRPHAIPMASDQSSGPTTTITVGRIRYTTRGTDIRVNHDKASGATEVVTNNQVRVTELPRRSRPRVVKPATGTDSGKQ